MKMLRSTIRTVLCTTLLGGVLTVAVVAALPALPASAAAPTCTDTWNVTTSGTYSWGTSADWSNGLPGASSIVCITKPGKYTVQLIGGTTTIDALEVGSGTVGDNEILDLFGTCSNNAALDTNNTAVSSDNDDINSTGSVFLGSTACGNAATLGIGTVLNVNSGGVLEADNDSGGTRYISGNVTNDGTVNIDDGSQYTSGTWDNAGAVNIGDGESLTADTATPIATFTDDTGGSVTSNGTSQTGQLVIDGGDTYNQGNGTTSGEPVLLDNGGIALHYTGTGSSTIETLGVGTLDGNMSSGQTLEINGTCSDNGAETEDASLTNHGTIELTSVNCGNQSTLAIGTGLTLTNDGTLEALGGDGGTRYISGNVTNDGTVNIDEESGYSSGTWDNAGALDLATGDSLTVTTATPIATFTDDTGGSIVSTGTGQLVVDEGNTFNQGNGTATGGEPVLLNNGNSGTINLHYTGSGAGPFNSTIETLGLGTVTGTVESGETLDVTGTCSNNAVETAGGSVKDYGTINLTSAACGNPSTIAIPKAYTLTVEKKTGQLNAVTGDGGQRYITGTVVNKGSVGINQPSTYTPNKKGTFTNRGTLTVASSETLSVASVKKAIFLNTKKGVITGSGQVTVNGLTTFEDAGTATITGTPVVVNAAKLDLTSTGAGTIDVEGTSTFVGNIAKGQTVNILGMCSDNATLTGAASVTNAGTLNLSNVNCGNASEFTLGAGETLTNTSTGVIETLTGSGGAVRTIDANVTNQGTFGPSEDNTLTIDGNLTDTSTAVFDANVASSASDGIAMGAGDTATLAGTLTAVPVAGFTPSSGYSATILSGTYTGTFSTVGPAGWSAAYGTVVTLNFT